MPTTIHATRTNDPFSRVLKSFLNDPKLSWKAKGIAAYLLGQKDGWRVNIKDIENHGTDGERAIRSALKELRILGYAKLTCLKERGSIRSWLWEVSDCSIFCPDVRFADVGNGHLIKNKCIKNESKESKETSSSDDALYFSPEWKPDSRTKEEKLKSIPVPKHYPSEIEVDEFIEQEELDYIVNCRPDIYRNLCINKWRTWNARLEKWIPIVNWKKYILGLNTKISEAI